MRQKDEKLILFENIFHATRDKLFAFTKGILLDESRVQDCMQQCYMKIWESLDAIDTTKDIMPFLYTVCRNITIDHLRKNARYVWVDDLSVYTERAGYENNIELYLKNKDRSLEVDQLLHVLPPRRREVFKLIKLQGFSYREAASYLNISVHTVDKHMQEAYKTLTTEHVVQLMLAFYLINQLHV